jgi:hypothetical protein
VPGDHGVKNLSEAIYSKFTGSAFSTSVGGRLYKHRTKQSPTWPYAVFYMLSDMPIDTFVENIEEVDYLFQIFSSASGSTEIEDAFTNLCALYDDCILTVTSNTFLSMERMMASLSSIPGETSTGTGEYWQYDVEYKIRIKRN